MQDHSSATYQPPTFRTFAQRKQEKERLLALAAGKRDVDEQGISFGSSTTIGENHASPVDPAAFSRLRSNASSLPNPPSQQLASITVYSSIQPTGHSSSSYEHGSHLPTSPLACNAEYEQSQRGHALPASFSAQDIRRTPTNSSWPSRLPNSTPLPALPVSMSTPIAAISSSKRPLPHPAGAPLINPAMYRVTTAPVYPGSRTVDMSPLPTLHHFASQPDLTSARQKYYSPQPDLGAHPRGAMRATPSIPNLRYSPVVSSPSDLPPSTCSPQLYSASSGIAKGSESMTGPTSSRLESISQRPLPTPLKTRSSPLASIPEPSNRQPVAMVSSVSLGQVPQSAPLLKMARDSDWTNGVPSDHQTSSRAMDRSDTLTSVKSLDRWDLSQNSKQNPAAVRKERPLPSAPGHPQGRGLALSRSLDRGTLQDGTHPPTILALTPAVADKLHGGFVPGAGSERMIAQAWTAPVSHTEITYPASVPAGQPTDDRPLNGLETQQTQINSAMAAFRIDGVARDENVESVDEATPEFIGSDRYQAVPLANPTDSKCATQVAAMSLNGIPTIVFPDSEEDWEQTVETSERASSPGPSVGYASAPPAISITITTDGAERMPAPAIVVSEEGVSQGNDAMDSLQVTGRSDTNTPACSKSEARPASSSPATCGIFCHACDLVILGSIVNAMEKGWHPACFRCTTCKMPLEHVSSFEHEGRAYCHMDYHEQFAPKCHHCNTPIIDQRFITIDDSNFGKRFYHELHFFCGECGIPFLDPSQSSSAGTELQGKGDKDGAAYEEEQTAAFVIHGKHAFCPECDIKLHRPKCKGCRKPIRSEDEALEALKAKWHRACFKCTSCQETIPTKHFIPIDRKPYCQDCYAAST